MSGAHHHELGRGLYCPGTSPVHRLAAPAKLVGLAAFAVVVALTPRPAVAAVGAQAAVAVGVIVLSRLSPWTIMRRLVVVVPFLVLAALVPVVAGGERVDVGPVSLSVAGLWAGWSTATKALLGATASIVVASTTPVQNLIGALARLGLPHLFVAIIASALRYVDLVVDDLGRTRRAMAARGHNPTWIGDVGPLASASGALFVRTYERGERVHGAMLARGYDGRTPTTHGHDDDLRLRAWVVALVPAALAAAVLVAVIL